MPGPSEQTAEVLRIEVDRIAGKQAAGEKISIADAILLHAAVCHINLRFIVGELEYLSELAEGYTDFISADAESMDTYGYKEVDDDEDEDGP